MGLQIRDYQVKKNIRWYILRLLRLGSRTRQELIDKLSDMYLGYDRIKPGQFLQMYLQLSVDSDLQGE